MDAGDYKLLQILLGPKYCQLWQYWAAHSVISYNMLSIVKAGDCNLSIKVATKQQKLLEEQKKLLNQKRELLRSGRKEEVEGIKKNQDLVTQLLEITRDEAEKYKDKIKKENKITNNIYRLFHVPKEAGLNKYQTNAAENNCNILSIRNENNTNIYSTSYEYAFGYIAEALDVIGNVVRTSVVDECEKLIKKTEKELNKAANECIGTITKISDNINEVNQTLNGEGGRRIENIIRILPDCKIGGDVSLKDGAHSTVVCVRSITKNVSEFLQESHDNIDKLDCIVKKIEELDAIMKKLTKFQDEKEGARAFLEKALNNIESNVFQKMSDNKIIGKQFVNNMYEKLLNRYLRNLKEGRHVPSGLLRQDVKELGVEKVRNLIESSLNELSPNLMYSKMHELLFTETQKKNPNLNIIKVLMVNGACLYSVKKDQCNNNYDELNKLARKSINIIMMEVHDMLFDFYDNELNLISRFPSKGGEFKKGNSHERVLLTNTGDKKYQNLAQELEGFIVRRKQNQEDGTLGREHTPMWSMLYRIWDLLTFLQTKRSADFKEYKKIDYAMSKFCDVLTYAAVFNDESIMRDYISEVQEKMQSECDKDILGLYRIITGETWAGWWNKTQKWNEVNDHYKAGSCLQRIREAIENRLNMEENDYRRANEQEIEQERREKEQYRQEKEQERREKEQFKQKSEQERREKEQFKQ
ncbi:Hypothetical protein CINCED_3A009695, partial [Cinara cedri]